MFAEAALRGAAGRHTWVGGVAFERESFDPLHVPQFAYYHRVPGVFAQDDIRWNDWLTVSASARLDLHHTYGTFFSPRASALIHKNGWTSRVSAGPRFSVDAADRGNEGAGLAGLAHGRTSRRGDRGSIRGVTRAIGIASITERCLLIGDHSIQVDRET